MKGKIFEGIVTALVTPFKNGAIDEEAFRRHINSQIADGVNALLPCGTTGESPTLSHDEHKEVVRICVEEVAGRVPVLAGAGSNSTAEAVDFALHAKKMKADGILLVSPYYNKPTQEGLFQHFTTVAKAAALPVILYNIPGRCAVNILPETILRMFKANPDICGVKEATGDMNQMIRTIELLGDEFLVTSGDDGLFLPLLSVGGRGVISVASNIIPKPLVQTWKLWNEGKLKEARELFFKMLPLLKALFTETNPMPLKASLALLGKMDAEMRLPMCQPMPETMEKLKPILKAWELLK